MSETIDSKVVEMRFDNKDFEANTRITMSTLDKLKAKLHFPGASKGLEEIGDTAKRVDFSGMSSGVETVQAKLSAMQVVGITALQNITNAAMTAGKQLTDAITIDPVKDGFAEYETQMNAVQTILANTQKEGTNVETVNKALDELNTYADKTIYNFTEMTRNIGTFTAAGVKLDASVSAIKGIANLAAVSGSTSQQASTAMYQLSQALAAGKVQLMDWNSVVNAGMGGQVFQDALIRTSEHLQTGAKAAIEAQGSFRESLQDEWLTTDVLTQTLDQFATAADTQEEYNAAIQKFVDQGYTQEQAKEMADMAKTAGDAATKVKTFTQLIDTLKEALGSGWTKTWQLIVGDFEEAKEVWTKVSDVLGGFINKASDARNAIVEAAMGNPYSDLAKNIQKVTDATSDYKDIVDSVIRGNYGNGQPRFDKLASEGYDWARVQNLVNERLGCSFRYTEELTTSQEDLNKEQAKTIDQILKMSDAELTKNGLTKEDVKALKELQKQSEKTGIPINDLINDMDKLSGKELLHGSVANMGNALINLFTEIHNAWQKVFDPVSAMTLYNIIASMHGVTSKFLKFTKDNGDELTRTLAGVFAALDIIRQCLGGSLKFSIKAINAVLSVFGMNTLDLTADLGDLLVKFDKWLKKTDPFTQGFTKVGEGIKFVVEQFDKFVAFLNTIPEFQAFTAELNSFKESIKGLSFEDIQKNFEKFVSYIESILPKSMKNVGKNVISGFKNGLSSGKTEIPKILADIGIRLLKAIKKVLGIHSPSKEMEKVGENTLSGLWNGLISGRIKIVDFFKTLGSDMLNRLQSIDWDNVVAGGIGVGLVWGLKKLYDIADKALSPAEGIGKVLSGVGEVVEKSADKIPKILNNASKVVKSFSKVLKAKAFKTRMEGVKDLAISIAILAGSLWVLSTINTDALHNAEEAMLILGGTLAVMTWVMDKLSSASASVGKDGIQVNGLKTGLAGLGIAVLLIAESVKILGKLNEDEINQGMECAGLLLLGITGILFMYGELVKGEAAKNIDKAGKMISKIGKTMLLIVGIIKLFSMLSVDEVENGLNFAGVFLGFVIAYLAISNLAGDKIDSVGKMVKSIVVSMGLMVGVVKLVSKLEPGEMSKGAAFAAVFAGFVWLLVKITKSNEKIMDGLGKLLLSVSASMLIMVGVAKLAGQLSMGEIVKAIAFAGAFLLFIKALKKITTDSGTGETVKLAGTLLAVSVAIGILAGIAVLLGLVDTKQLAKGVLAVTLLGAIMTAMIWATRGANDVKGNVIAMAVAIGVMAAAVAALSMIDSTKLAIATACLGSLMGMFALIELAGSKAKGSIAMIATMVIAVAALAGILGVMSALQVENALPNALALSALLLSLSVSMAIIGKVGTISAKALISVGVMTLVVAALAGILYLIRDLNPESSIGNAEALSILLLSLSASCGILAAVGLAGTAGFVGIGVLAALITAVGAIVAAIGALVKKFPQLEEFLDKGIPILQKIGYALGSFLGNIVGGFTEGATSGLPGVGKNLSDFMKNAQPFIDGAKGIDSSVTTGITSLCKAILTLTGTDFLNVIASVFSMGNVSFVKMGEQLKPFGEALSDYAQSVKGINAEDIQASAKAAKALVALNDALPKSGGLFGMITGNKDLSKLAGQLKSFGTGLNDYSKTLTDVNPEKVSGASEAVKSLVEAVNATDSVRANGVGTFVQAIDTLAETNVKGFMNAFKDSSSDVRNVGSTLTSSLAKGMKSKTSAVTSSAAKVVDSMETAMSSKEKEFQRIGVALISAFALGIQAQTTQAVNAATYLGTASAYGVSQAYTNFYMNGINLGSGLVIGMNAMQNSVYNAGYALGQAAVRGEKAGQKSHSPSKLTIQAGKWLGEGLIIGMNAMESKTYDAGQNMGETAFASIRKALSGMNDLVDSNMDTSPTIRPVLDLTNVKAGAGQMNDLFSDPSFTPLATLRAIGNLSNRNRQNGNSEEVVRAIGKLEKSLKSVGNTYNSINGITYDNDSEISEAVETLVRAATVGRRR
jgi:tape measure domain-containing protein